METKRSSTMNGTNGDSSGSDAFELALIDGTWFIDGIPD